MSVFSPIIINSNNSSGGDTPTPSPTIANCLYPVDNDCRPTGDCVVPNNVTRIQSSQTFSNSADLKSVTFTDNSVTYIGINAFANCSKLIKVNNTDNVTVINNNAFADCPSLTTINVNNVTQVFTGAFSNCGSIDNLNFDSINPQGYFYNSTFTNCVTLNNITVTANNFNYGAFCFYNCSNLSSATCEQLLSLCTTGSYSNQSTFAYCNSLTTLNLPKVTRLGTNFFNACANLTTINLPNCTELGQDCFNNCVSLSTVTISTTTNSLIAGVFRNCPSLTNVENFDTCKITQVTNYLFCNCSSLETITIPNNVTSLGTRCFEGCTNIKTITIPNNVKTIANHVFVDCTSLKNIVNYENCSITEITNNCFDGCTSLENITIPNKVTKLGISTFNDCTGLKVLSLPNTITTQTQTCLTNIVNSYFLNNCKSLENVSLGQGWKLPIRLNCTSNLTKESMVTMFNNLATVTKSTTNAITLGYGNLIKLSSDDIAIATGKNWTIPQSDIFTDSLSAIIWEVTEIFASSNMIRLLEFYFYNSDGTKIQPTGCYCDHAPTSAATDANTLIDNKLTTAGSCSINWQNYTNTSNKKGSCRFIFTFESEDVINSIATYQFLYYPNNTAAYRNTTPISWNMYKKLSTTQEVLIHTVEGMELPNNLQTAIGTDKFEIPTT